MMSRRETTELARASTSLCEASGVDAEALKAKLAAAEAEVVQLKAKFQQQAEVASPPEGASVPAAKPTSSEAQASAPSSAVTISAALPADSHLRLGMNLSGLHKFCKLIGFPVYGEEIDGYTQQYLRSKHGELKWVTVVHGKELVGHWIEVHWPLDATWYACVVLRFEEELALGEPELVVNGQHVRHPLLR